MSRTHLLGAVSAAALSLASLPASAAYAPPSSPPANAITGGGSTLAEFDYFVEFYTFNSNQSASGAQFYNSTAVTGEPNTNDFLYWPAGSGSGQAAFLTDDITCDSNKVEAVAPTTGPNSGTVGACTATTVGGANVVDYGASDATLSSTQISGWSTSTVGQKAAGNLIQLPSMGVGVSFPVVNAKVTANGATTANKAQKGGITLTDNDLCGIFSGKFTNWNQTSATKLLAPGTITVVYRSDGSGTSFLLLNHLAAVCTTSNSNFPAGFTPSTTFASTTLFPNGVPTTFVGQSGSQNLASYLANGEATPPATPVTSAIGYLSPDFTTVDPSSNAVLANGKPSPLVVAAAKNSVNNAIYIPTVTNITNALNHVGSGATNATPPANASAGAMPANYVPLVPTPALGYPVVGYTTFDFAQCYATPAVASGIISFLTDHYSTTAAYATSISNNGFVSISSSGAKAFVSVITGGILGNTKKWNDNIENATACKGLVGR